MQPESSRRQFAGLALSLGLAFSGVPVRAAPVMPTAPEGRLVFGFAVSGAMARLMDELLAQLRGYYRFDFGQALTILQGNSGAVAFESVRNAPADGSSVLLAASSLFTLQPLLRKLSNVDPIKDFVPVAAVCEFTSSLVVGTAVPAEVRTLADYLAWVRRNPLQMSYGLPGLGTAAHLVGMEVARHAGLPLKPVAYKGLPALLDDLQSGALAAAIVPMISAAHAERAGHVRLLSVSSDRRWPSHPNVPTLAELGLPGVQTVDSLGFFVRADTPPEAVRELADALQRAARSAPLQAAMAEVSMRPVAQGPSYAEAIAGERAAWAAHIQKHRLTLDS